MKAIGPSFRFRASSVFYVSAEVSERLRKPQRPGRTVARKFDDDDVHTDRVDGDFGYNHRSLCSAILGSEYHQWLNK